MSEKVIKGVLNSRTGDDGELMYKVRYDGLDKSADEWLKAHEVSDEHVRNFEKRKAKKAQQSSPKMKVEKKRKAETEPSDGAEGDEGEAEDEEEDEERDGESKSSKLEYDEGAIAVAADEVDPSLIIPGGRRKRAAAAKAEQSADWKGLLDSKLSALGDSDSDSD